MEEMIVPFVFKTKIINGNYLQRKSNQNCCKFYFRNKKFSIIRIDGEIDQVKLH